MDESGTIVVGVDGSAESRAALRHALEDAARRTARVRVVSVFQPPEYWAIAYGMAAPPTPEEVAADVETSTEEMVAAVVAEHPGLARVPVDIRALAGAPAKTLIDQAQGAQLLVLGHRGRGGFTSALLGSVGMQCVLHAACPVTIVRPAEVPVDEPATESGTAVPASA
ncbi:universal stress protein [Pseudonocardia acidicola]|uniref:Universal stress protein n=1 Tax=Pseudonocardia acidicola TaxID=2724939 RepID=A0ABX1SDY0_9PSEU|nr:universal stress protein [Pseudonocardia acidicola]NMH99315.1 universal stress protein [Pseudonocardia acidicola]